MQAAAHDWRGFWRSLEIQGRIIYALIMREILTRYGRHNIGFMWVFVEPMMFTLGVLGVYSLMGHHSQLPIIPFTVTGYATVLLWRNAMTRCGNALEPNRSLLHHRNVRIIDFFAARLILEVVGSSISFLILMTVLSAVGAMRPPDDILKMIIGWVLLAWFAFSGGMFVGTLGTVSETFERVWHVFTYLFMPASGAFFMVDWLPKRMQDLALLVPTVHCAELIREGLFGSYIHPHYQLQYMLIANCVATLMGLVSVRRLAATVEGA